VIYPIYGSLALAAVRDCGGFSLKSVRRGNSKIDQLGEQAGCVSRSITSDHDFAAAWWRPIRRRGCRRIARRAAPSPVAGGGRARQLTTALGERVELEPRSWLALQSIVN